MSDRHALATDGSWVQLRDPRTLKSGDKRKVLRAIRDTENLGEATLSIQDGITVVAVEAWSLPLPVPGQDIAVLDMMEVADYDRLGELLGPTQDALFPEAPAPTPEQQADPASPTGPSAA